MSIRRKPDSDFLSLVTRHFHQPRTIHALLAILLLLVTCVTSGESMRQGKAAASYIVMIILFGQ